MYGMTSSRTRELFYLKKENTMIIHSPESAMPEPYNTYIRQRSEAITTILDEIVDTANVQLCPQAITPTEQLFKERSDCIYGAVVRQRTDGDKSVLYTGQEFTPSSVGVATSDLDLAMDYAHSRITDGNRLRIKNAQESDSRGQITVGSIAEAEAAFSTLTNNGENLAVLMPHIDVTRRVSVGRIALGTAGTFFYAGNEHTTIHNNQTVYGGTTLGLFNERNPSGLLEVARHLNIPRVVAQVGIRAIILYDSVALPADRVSVDILEGRTDNGTLLRDVVDITPRVGGATPAEVLAMRAVVRHPNSTAFARSELHYEPLTSPETGVNFVDTDTLVINAQLLGATQ